MGLKEQYFKLRDKLRFNWAQKLYDIDNTQQDINQADINHFQHIVVLKTDGKLGDTQVMSHFYTTLLKLRALRQSKPKLILSVICTQNLKDIYQQIFNFDHVLIANKKSKHSEIKNLCAKLVNIAPVDLIISTEPNYRPRDFLFNYYLKAPYIASCELRAKGVNLIIYDPYKKSKTVAQCFVDLLRKLKVDEQYLQVINYVPLFTQHELTKAQQFMESISFTQGKIIGLNPYASSSKRSFNESQIEYIISKLEHKANLNILLLMPHNDKSEALVNSLQNKYKNIRLALMMSNTSAMEYAAIISILDGLISVDTAAVHLACASNIPFSVIYVGLKDIEENIESSRWAPLYGKERGNFIASSKSNYMGDLNKQVLDEAVEHLINRW